MSSMKKLVNLLLVSFIILSLLGCSKPNEELPNNDNVLGDIESSKENNEDKTTNNDVAKDENNSNNEEVNSTQNNKPVTPNENNNTSPNKNEPSKNNTVTHTHEWAEIYEIVKHDEIGHYETVVVQEAWDEVIVIQESWDEVIVIQESWDEVIVDVPGTPDEYVSGYRCSRCGEIIGASSAEGADKLHTGRYHNGMHTNYVYTEYTIEGTPDVTHTVHHEAIYNVIHHEAVKEDKWVIDQQAYEEKAVAGYKCSKCGEFKQ